MENHTTLGNSSPVATTVAAGINVKPRPDWNWEVYADLAQERTLKNMLDCPVCGRQKTKDQTVCQVCYTNILDSRNGFYPDRLSKSTP